MSDDYGIKFMIDGKDALTGVDLDASIYSKYANKKESLSGSGAATVSSFVTKTISIFHNLGYIPKCTVFGLSFKYVDGSGNPVWRKAPFAEDIPSIWLMAIDYRFTSTYLYIDLDWANIDEGGGDAVLDYKYFINKDKGKL